MDFLDLAHNRFSVLEYSDAPVEQEKIDKIILAGIAAPTACNFQPQRIRIVDDNEGRQKLKRVVPSKYHIPVAFLIYYDRRNAGKGLWMGNPAVKLMPLSLQRI